jgi:hypothetical protein
MKFGDPVKVRLSIMIICMVRNIKIIEMGCMLLKNCIFGKSTWSVSTIANGRMNAQFVNDILIMMNLTNKDDVVTSFVGWNQNIILMSPYLILVLLLGPVFPKLVNFNIALSW